MSETIAAVSLQDRLDGGAMWMYVKTIDSNDPGPSRLFIWAYVG